MTQPFYISESMAKRLGYWAYQDWLKGKRYLPALEPDDELPPIPEQQLPSHAFEQLKGQLLHLQNKLNEHIDASKKRRGKY